MFQSCKLTTLHRLQLVRFDQSVGSVQSLNRMWESNHGLSSWV